MLLVAIKQFLAVIRILIIRVLTLIGKNFCLVINVRMIRFLWSPFRPWSISACRSFTRIGNCNLTRMNNLFWVRWMRVKGKITCFAWIIRKKESIRNWISIKDLLMIYTFRIVVLIIWIWTWINCQKQKMEKIHFYIVYFVNQGIGKMILRCKDWQLSILAMKFRIVIIRCLNYGLGYALNVKPVIIGL